jgi:hypothetical protein
MESTSEEDGSSLYKARKETRKKGKKSRNGGVQRRETIAENRMMLSRRVATN